MSADKAYRESVLPELWGGIECTINRIGDRYRDQLQYAGHYVRPGDIERLASLGIRKLRYPVLWEKHEPKQGQPINWSWTAAQLNRIRQAGMEPIAGLLHHGSGPSFTDLGDPDFASKLAAYAEACARRFPWLSYYTPVNEPLTTARFSGLYGFWYPHQKNELAFVRMLLNQVKAVILSMRAIRKINPDARLVQTEDLGKTHSTPLLAYQAAFENRRRWLTYDLLCGKLDKGHYFRDYFLRLGIPEKELAWFEENSLPPDIAGLNYYITSERYLDENLSDYPSFTHGGNYQHSYADTEAVRSVKPAGISALLEEAWSRYRLPLAITECHLSCTREEQLRWVQQTWKTACSLIKQDVDLRAVTAWALLGAFDWNSLLTVEQKHYEAGAFDLHSPEPRPTAVAKLLRSLSGESGYDHPLLDQPGWWEKKENMSVSIRSPKKARPCLIVGRHGTLATAFSRICEHRSIPYVSLSRQELAIRDPESIRRAIETYDPWALINASGYVKVDEAELFPEECRSINAEAPACMAGIAREKGIRFMTFSSDLVFNGEKNNPYHETDAVKPLSVYGASKAEGENSVSAIYPQSLIIRTSAFFGPWDRYNFIYHVRQALRQEASLAVAADVVISPTYVPDLVNAALDLFIDDEEGIWHLSNDGRLTWADLARQVAERNGSSIKKLISTPLCEMDWKAPRPLYSALVSGKGARLATLDNALNRYFAECCV